MINLTKKQIKILTQLSAFKFNKTIDKFIQEALDGKVDRRYVKEFLERLDSLNKEMSDIAEQIKDKKIFN